MMLIHTNCTDCGLPRKVIMCKNCTKILIYWSNFSLQVKNITTPGTSYYSATSMNLTLLGSGSLQICKSFPPFRYVSFLLEFLLHFLVYFPVIFFVFVYLFIFYRAIYPPLWFFPFYMIFYAIDWHLRKRLDAFQAIFKSKAKSLYVKIFCFFCNFCVCCTFGN